VTAAARDVRASVCALGLGSDAVVTVSPEEAVGGLLPAATALLETASAMDGLRACTRVRNNAAAARRVADTIAAAVREGAPAAMAAALSGVSREGLHRDVRIEGLDELVDRAHDHVDEAERCAAQLRVAPFEETFLALVSRFERTYAVMKRDRGMLDFEDLQVMTARLLESRPDVAAEFRGRFAMVMIDEFQDANALQLRIAESLAAGNLCTVGDENQSIYGFRHADVEVFRQRARRIERHQPLHTNYRIDPRLLAGLSAVFAHPALLGSAFVAHPWPEWSPPVPVGGSVYAGAPFELRFVDFSEVTGPARKLCEAGHIADRVEELVGEGVQPNDIAVLLRRLASGRALAVERALRARGVPATLNSGGAFFECAEVVESRALLRAIDNVLDDRALVSVLAGRFVGLRDDALFTIRQHAERRAVTLGLGRRDTHLWPALERAACELEPADAAALARIVGVIHQARKNRGARSLETILLDALHELDADLVWFAGEPPGHVPGPTSSSWRGGAGSTSRRSAAGSPGSSPPSMRERRMARTSKKLFPAARPQLCAS
jgi:superfamily I DNA/RNA helicase